MMDDCFGVPTSGPCSNWFEKTQAWLDSLPPPTLGGMDPIPEPLMVPLYPKTEPDRKFDEMAPRTRSATFREKLVESYGGYAAYFGEKLGRDKLLDKLGFVKGTATEDPWLTMGDFIQEGEYYKCLAGAILSPTHFYVNPLDCWNRLERLMGEMQKDYANLDTLKCLNPAIPWRGHLEPGVLIMAKCREPLEYHRALVIKVFEQDENYYQVRLLDYGDCEWVHINNLRYMKRMYLKKLHFQAIRCRLMLGRRISWSDNLDGKILRQLVYDKTLVVKFMKKQKDGSTTFWDVFLHTIDNKEKKVTEFHVERRLLRMTRRGEGVDPEKIQTDTVETLKVMSFRKFEMANVKLK